MKKLNVEIRRIDEDVVTTSSVVCSHPGTEHYRITNTNPSFNPRMFNFDYYNEESTTISGSDCNYADLFEDWENAQVGDWYYYDEDASEAKKCNGDHSNYSISD